MTRTSVSITAADIADGIPGDPERCALALAIRREFAVDALGEVYVHPDEIILRVRPGEWTRHFAPSPEMRAFLGDTGIAYLRDYAPPASQTVTMTEYEEGYLYGRT